MTRSIAWLLILLGSAAAGTAIIFAVLELGHIYNEAVDDPMGMNSPEPQDRASTMLKLVVMGVPGIVVSLVGVILLYKARIARIRRVQ